MAFEQFVKSPPLLVSISPKGEICIGKAEVDRFRLGRYKYALLFFDRETMRIGIRFTDNGYDNGFALSKKVESFLDHRTVIDAESFLRFYEIDYSERRDYVFRYDEESQLHTIQL